MLGRTLFAIVLVAALLAGAPLRAETLTDDTVVQLSKAGLSPETIVAKIRASANRFDVSTDALLWLKRQDVPDAVIAAMVTAEASEAPVGAADQGDSADPMAPHPPGVYLLQTAGDRPRMQRLDPTVASDSRATGSVGWILTYGLVPLKVTTVMAGPTAPFRADTLRPTFYFYFNQPGSGLYQNGLGMMRLQGPNPSPGLFALVHFQSVGGHREVLTTQLGFVGSRPVDVDKTKVAFSADVVAPGVYRVTPDADLEPGEYAFVCTPDSSGDDSAEPRYFDFSAPG